MTARRRLVPALATVTLTIPLLLIAPTTAHADDYSGTAQATESVYYRLATDMSATDAIDGVGLYSGETAGLICGTTGSPVGPYANERWHIVANLSRPDAGEGLIPDHFLTTPNGPNEPTPGEPECTQDQLDALAAQAGNPVPAAEQDNLSVINSTTTSAEGGASMFFSPGDQQSPADVNVSRGSWDVNHDCSSSTVMNSVPADGRAPNGRPISMISGFSAGRDGVFGVLQANPAWLQQVRMIVLFDPGSVGDFQGDLCGENDPSEAVLQWLKQSPYNRLVVLSGEITEDAAHPINGYGSGGIQNYVFGAAHATNNDNILSQIVVCNYDGMGHWDVFHNFQDEVNNYSLDINSCPTAPDGTEPSAAWSP